ncbi:hypothetical protein JCGZ_00430 [Jatropha curcas]|uniref:Gamma-interferon-inducible lysosomal thiol reductase n=1 Tax=Jatropha curcas TaxID=180498 RepID=A0A067JJ60_JATCU|nr:hypothetical protein JCGZ_00430 [Jatropha curcas]
MSIFNNGLIDIVNLKMVPWGNAHVDRLNNTLACQNGLDECELNTIHACAINAWHNKVDKYYALIYCTEFIVIEGRHQNWTTCFNSLGLSEKPVFECLKNGTGTKLEILHGYETAHLSPPPSFMPWVIVNNHPLGNDYANFASYVCNAYKGNVIPSVCKLPLERIRESKPVHPVCYRTEAKTFTSFGPVKRISRSRKVFQKGVLRN